MKQSKVYLASPFFNEEQLEREERIKNKLRQLGYEVYAPLEHGKLEPNATEEDRNKIFEDNVANIMDADIVFAITDGKDIGTIWEAGFACGMNTTERERTRELYDKAKVVYYAETLGDRPFNVMLAKSADVVITKFEELDNLEIYLETKKGYNGTIQ